MSEHPIWDSAAIGVAVAALVGWLPAITTILSFIYVCIRLYETPTVQAALERLKRWRSG